MTQNHVGCGNVLEKIVDNYFESVDFSPTDVDAENIKTFFNGLSNVLIKDVNVNVQNKILDIVQKLIEIDKENVVNNAKTSFLPLAKILKNCHNYENGCTGVGNASLFSLKLLIKILVCCASTMSKEQLKIYQQLLFILPSGCILSSNKKLINSTKNLLKLLEYNQPNFLHECITILLDMEPKAQALSFVALYYDIKSNSKDAVSSDLLLEYIKLFFNDKIPIPLNIFNSSVSLFKKCIKNSKDFEGKLLPILNKMILRAPEKALNSIFVMLKHVTYLDLSGNCSEMLTKSLLTQLNSRSDVLRLNASYCISMLSKYISDSNSIIKISDLIFDLLQQTGSDRISHLESRNNVYTLLGNIVENIELVDYAAKVNVTDNVIKKLINLLDKETAESTIIVILETIEKWSKLIPDQILKCCLEYFQLIINKKMKTSNKTHYFHLLNNCCNNVQKLNSLKPYVTQLKNYLVEFNKTQFNVLQFVEIFPLIDLLLRYMIEAENCHDLESFKNSTIFSIIGLKNKVDNSKMLNDVFLKSLSISSINCFVSVAQNILIYFFDSIKNLPEHYNKLLVQLYHCCLHNNYNEVRQFALKSIKILVRSQNGIEIADFYINHIYSINLVDSKSLISSWYWPQSENWSELYDIYDLNSLRTFIHRIQLFLDTLFSLSYESKTNKKIALITTTECLNYPVQWTIKERAHLLFKALKPLNQYVLVHFYPNLWANYSCKLLEDIEDLLKYHKEDIIQLLISENFQEKNGQSLLNCICNNFPDSFISELLESIIVQLQSPKFIHVTLEQIGIMNTRDNYLYNKDLLDSLPKYESKSANIKRETKNYSYKEQLVEMELLKELEESKMKKSKSSIKSTNINSDNPLDLVAKQLTKKQLETINEELKKEQMIRQNIKSLEITFNSLCDIIDSILKLRTKSIENILYKIINLLQNLLIDSELGRIKIMLLLLNIGDKLTNFNKKEQIINLRVLFLDSNDYETKIKHCWDYNSNMNELNRLIDPYCVDPLEDQVKEMIKIHLTKYELDFKSFIYIIPMISKLCTSIFLETEDNEFYWMDLDQLNILIKWLNQQIKSTRDLVGWQLLNGFDLTKMTIICLKECEDVALQNWIGKLLTELINLLNKSKDDGIYLKDTPILINLIDCLITNCDKARLTGLVCLNYIEELESNNLYHDELDVYLWMLKFDEIDEISEQATSLCNKLNIIPTQQIALKLLDFTIIKYEKIINCAVKSLTELINQLPDLLFIILNLTFEKYDELKKRKPAVYDAVGRLLKPEEEDKWFLRKGTSITLVSLAPLIKEKEHIDKLFHFFIDNSLKDINSDIRQLMLKSGRIVIKNNGKDHIDYFIDIFENYLSLEKANDLVKECVVIFLGELASHLNVNDDRFSNIFGRLIKNLSSPCEDVQKAVSETLEPLVKRYDEDKRRDICDDLISVLLKSKNRVESRGAAYGIAGALKSIGITRLKTYQIQEKLLEGLEDRLNEQKREMVLFTYEQISRKMGKMFEPYIPSFLKQLQDAFGDSSSVVRKAANQTAKTIMANLSAPGVKIILNPLLEGLEANQWRTKAICAEMLGNMSHCAPKQLSNCLPTIVPKILSILSDSHPNVVKAGQHALREIGAVIQNKEMLTIVPVVIEALCEPKTKTDEGLEILIQTKFIHKVDPASLALMMSMVTRAFRRERRSETKRKAAQIIANLHSLTDDKDLQPYCGDVLPGLKNCLTDAEPYVRTVASVALGTVAKVMRDEVYEELLKWLMNTLKDDTNSVNRSGAAQGLSEVLGKKGFNALVDIMPDIMENSSNLDLLPHIRDGYLKLYIHLPRIFQEKFAQYVPKILPAILQALSDESEFVRETALEAATGIIEIYSHIALDTMLPDLEAGLLDSNWRIRDSSIKLLGKLLFRLIGISGKGTTVGGNDDDTFAKSDDQKLISDSIGQARFDFVLAKLYLSRMDTTYSVKQHALHIWKLVVHNTVRTLRQILPQLMQIIMECLSSDNEDNQSMASHTLADIVKKVGERSVPDIFKSLVDQFNTCKSENRVGICDAFASILRACNKDDALNYVDFVIPVFNQCICDSNEHVRVVAVQLFDSLHKMYSSTGPGGSMKIMDLLLPNLINKLSIIQDDEQIKPILDGLSTLVMEKSKLILPYLIPRLTNPIVHTRALSHLAGVAGEIIGNHLINVLPILLDSVATHIGDKSEVREVRNCCDVFLALRANTQMILSIIRELQNMMAPEKTIPNQITALKIMGELIMGLSISTDDVIDNGDVDDTDDNNGADGKLLQNNTILLNYIPQIYRSVIKLFIKSDKSVLIAAYDCMVTINDALGEKNIEYVKDIRDSILTAIREKSSITKQQQEIKIDAFCISECDLLKIIDLYKDALMNGRAELKDVAASGIDDCLSVASDECISKAAVKIAGPIIRTMSDRQSSSTRAYMASSLGKLVQKCSSKIKLFHTQIVSILIRCLHEPNNYLRYRAQISLGQVIKVYPKPDNLLKDLMKQELSDSNQYKTSGYEAIRMCLESVKPGSLTNETVLLALDAFKDFLNEKDDQIRIISASIVGCSLVQLNDVNNIKVHLTKLIQSTQNSDNPILYKHAISIVLMIMCKVNCEILFQSNDLKDYFMKNIHDNCKCDKIFIANTGLRCLGFIAKYALNDGNEQLLNELINLINSLGWNGAHNSIDVKELVLDICSFICWQDDDPYNNVILYVQSITNILINGYRAKENVLKIKSERCILDLLRLSVSTRKILDDDSTENKSTNNKNKNSNLLICNNGVIDETVHKIVMNKLDQQNKLAITEVVNKFKKSLSTSSSVKEHASKIPDLDNTYNPVPSSSDMF